MIQSADFIAVVEIARMGPCEVKGTHWTYREAAIAKVERVLKCSLPAKVTLHGGEDFIRARGRHRPGRQLVFLRPDGKLFAGLNWHLGVRPFREDQVGALRPG